MLFAKLPFQRTRLTIYVAIRNVQFSKEVSTGMACFAVNVHTQRDSLIFSQVKGKKMKFCA